MKYRTTSTASKTGALSIPPMVAIALTIGSQAFAQQPPSMPADTAHNDPQHLEVSFSPWARYCTKGLKKRSSEITAHEVCFTAADSHLPTGQKLAIALLIEPEESDTKLLRVTLPLGVALVPGARIAIDEKDPMTAPFVVCLAKNGCMADYKADAELIAKLKAGRILAVQSFDKGKPISFTLPLAGFAQAYDGPAGDPTALNELEERLPSSILR